MMKIIDGLPANVLGIAASGRIGHADYKNVLIPAAENRMAAAPLKMLYAIDPDFSGFELAAFWDDALFGIKHMHDFERVAVVSDVAWIRDALLLFRPLLPCPVRLFDSAGLEAAKQWIASDDALPS